MFLQYCQKHKYSERCDTFLHFWNRRTLSLLNIGGRQKKGSVRVKICAQLFNYEYEPECNKMAVPAKKTFYGEHWPLTLTCLEIP